MPASVRHDRVRAEQMARELDRVDEESESTSWDQVLGRGPDELVSFGGLRERQGYAVTNHAANGTLYAAPAARAQNRASGQRLPHII